MVTVGVSEYFWWKIMVRAGGVISSKSGSPPSRPRWPLHLPRDARAASAAILRSMHSAESPAARPCTLQPALTWLLHACKNTRCVREKIAKAGRARRAQEVLRTLPAAPSPPQEPGWSACKAPGLNRASTACTSPANAGSRTPARTMEKQKLKFAKVKS